ncbi:MAG: hypothetical protein R2789_19450 [Microthrixaceae bacterium]
MQRDHHRQVEGDLLLVVGDEPSSLTVDLTGAELGHQVNLRLREHALSRFPATGLVNAASSGVTYVMSTDSSSCGR